jgi:hypothetical protein
MLLPRIQVCFEPILPFLANDTPPLTRHFTLAGKPTGSVSGQPPALADDSKAELLQASQSSKLGQTAPGRDGGDPPAGQKVKSEKERE